ncbi:MAG: (2Fe-2S) ferredoxin domain-containing protein, partial [bacterium]|nr:(2Fe-2S) ferredoxin domain-containing protein [bacterium]
DEGLDLVTGTESEKLQVVVCVGTGCYLRGAQDLLHDLIHHIEERGLQTSVDVTASFCFEKCDRGPVVTIGDILLERCTFDKACEVLEQEISITVQ